MMKGVSLAAACLFSLSLFTAGLVPLFDPDEGYYPATASESLSDAPPFDLRFNNEPRWDKPILSYALIEGSFILFGQNATTARLPSAAQGAALVVVVGLLVSWLAGRRAGALSASVLATTLAVQIFSRVAHPEIGLVFAITATQLLLCVWLTRHSTQSGPILPILIGAAVAYGILTKGPVAVILPALMVCLAAPWIFISRERWPVAVRDVAIIAVTALAIAVPWYAVMTARHGSVFLREALWQQNVMRYTSPSYGHPASLLFFVLPTAIGLLPWTAFLPQAFQHAFNRDVAPRQVLRTCMAASGITAFVFYSLSSSKLVNYSLVFMPPLAILIGLSLDERLERQPVRTTVADKITSVLLVVAAVVLLVSPLAFGRAIGSRVVLGGVPTVGDAVPELLEQTTIPIVVTLILASIVIAVASARVRISALFATGALIPLLIFFGARNVLPVFYPWEVFGQQIRTQTGPIWLYGYRAPSLTFYAGRPVSQVSDPRSLERHILERPDGWLVIDATTWSAISSGPAFTHRSVRLEETGGRMLLLRVDPSPATGQSNTSDQ